MLNNCAYGTYRAPATKPPVWFQWLEPISTTGSVTLNPNSQPKFQEFFTHSFTQTEFGAGFRRISDSSLCRLCSLWGSLRGCVSSSRWSKVFAGISSRLGNPVLRYQCRLTDPTRADQVAFPQYEFRSSTRFGMLESQVSGTFQEHLSDIH
jgi:hypothetical protein